MRTLKGIYYPYSRCLDEMTLKKSLLIFDELYFIDPIERLLREYFYHSDGISDFSNVMDIYSLLEEKKIVKKIFPFPEIRECDKLLWEAVATDEKDENYRSLFIEFNTADYWGIIKNKYRGMGGIYATTNIKAAMGYAMGGHMSEEEAKANNFYGTSEDFSSRYIMTTAHEYLPYHLGLALSINHTLVAIENSDFIPFTDSEIAYSALILKYKRAKENIQSAYKTHINSTSFNSQNYVNLAYTIIDKLIEDENIRKINITDILKLKINLEKDFNKFKEKIIDLSFEIQNELWNNEYHNKLTSIVNKEIKNEVVRLENIIKDTYLKMFGNLIKKTATATVPTLIGTIFTGLSPGQILGYSSLAVTGALTISIPEFVDKWLQNKEVHRNSLSFLVKLREKVKN